MSGSSVRARPRDCPCFSGLRYAACCAPFHGGERLAPTPEALMRSRYAAFALGLGDYLVRTLTDDHDDRAHEPAHLQRALSDAKNRQRFLGLTIHEATQDGDRGEVVFTARIFEKGVDRSFTERSVFRRENGEWRYADGQTLPGRPA